jgi:hypothetical protein
MADETVLPVPRADTVRLLLVRGLDAVEHAAGAAPSGKRIVGRLGQSKTRQSLFKDINRRQARFNSEAWRSRSSIAARVIRTRGVAEERGALNRAAVLRRASMAARV